MDVSNLTGKRLKNIKDSVVSDHLLQCNCTIDFDHFDILATDVSKFNLLVKESLLNNRDNPVLNRTTKGVFIWRKNIPGKQGPRSSEISPYKRILLKSQNL